MRVALIDLCGWLGVKSQTSISTCKLLLFLLNLMGSGRHWNFNKVPWGGPFPLGIPSNLLDSISSMTDSDPYDVLVLMVSIAWFRRRKKASSRRPFFKVFLWWEILWNVNLYLCQNSFHCQVSQHALEYHLSLQLPFVNVACTYNI